MRLTREVSAKRDNHNVLTTGAFVARETQDFASLLAGAIGRMNKESSDNDVVGKSRDAKSCVSQARNATVISIHPLVLFAPASSGDARFCVSTG
mgnify:CR=1 FL=1